MDSTALLFIVQHLKHNSSQQISYSNTHDQKTHAYSIVAINTNMHQINLTDNSANHNKIDRSAYQQNADIKQTCKL